jgi:hypothetical protein
MSGALGAIEASSGFLHKLCIVFRERRRCKLQQNVVFNPLLKLAHGQEDAFGFVGTAELLLIASGEGLFLLLRLQVRMRPAHIFASVMATVEPCRCAMSSFFNSG